MDTLLAQSIEVNGGSRSLDALVSRVLSYARSQGIKMSRGTTENGWPTWVASKGQTGPYSWSPYDAKYPSEEVKAMIEAVRWCLDKHYAARKATNKW